MASREELSTSFGAAAPTYEAGRPSYPADAVRWMLQPVEEHEPLRVADIGAGTGKLTRAVTAVGASVSAVDPDPHMLEQLRAQQPDVPVFDGSAEAMPLDDASMDAVLFGQSWHWVDPDAASAEAARVLRGGGVLGLVWNIRDDRVEWVRRLTAVMQGSHAERLIAEGGPRVAPPFGRLAQQSWRWLRPMTRDDLFALARSRSVVLTAVPEERARIEAGVAEVCDEIGAVGDAVVHLPYITYAFRGIRP